MENPITENNELLATKNALNIVNDDLKNRVDELTGEVDALREERNKLRTKVQDLEEEQKKSKEQVKQQRMGKEPDNLIVEINELLATKNALNIVKDDLIARVDELTGEVDILREELNAMRQTRNKLRTKVQDLEEELKKTKEQVKQQTDNDQEQNDVPLAQRKRFTRVEMAMVLMERNQYKERLMELQEAVRITEICSATRSVHGLDKKSKQAIWKYFSPLLSPSNRPQERGADGQGGGPMFCHSSPSHSHGSPSRKSENRLEITGRDGPQHPASAGLDNALANKDYAEDGISERARSRRNEQYRQLRAHVQDAYGWSMPGNKAEKVGKEIENLIMENNELLATKNDLKIVNDDLINRVDELTGVVDILREELNAMLQSRNKLRTKVQHLDEELKKTKKQVKQQTDNDQEENDVPLAQRKRFTRVEMAMVLMERNEYKKRLMELQEAEKQNIHKYFSNFFTPSNRPQERGADGQGGGPMFFHSSPSHSHRSPSRKSENRLEITGRDGPQHPASAGLDNALANKDYAEDGISERERSRRNEQYRQQWALVHKEDGR